MDLSYGPEYEEFRAHVRAFLERNKDKAPPASMRATEGVRELRDWQKVLVANGFAARTVPKEYGGFGARPDVLETIVIEEEFSRARVSLGIENQGISMFVPTLLQYGSEEQKRKWVAPTINGDMIWCQGYANAIFSHLSEKLPISRLPRDLTDSTVIRNIGVPMGHMLIAFKSLMKGLDKVILKKKRSNKTWRITGRSFQRLSRPSCAGKIIPILTKR